MTKPIVLIPHAPGTNRDGDAAHAIEMAGGEPRIVTLHALRADARPFREAEALLIPGGFSYGDALGAGQRWALDLSLFFLDELREFVESGKRVLGICNGFQVLVKAGLLPGDQAEGEPRNVTLTHNERGYFDCRWVHLSINPNSTASYLREIEGPIFCPIAHGEGNFQVRDEATLHRLTEDNLIAFRYVDRNGAPANGRFPLNPSGSVADIAGISNAKGNVLGLMPHPENHIMAVQNPVSNEGKGVGLALFEAMLG
ncbi:MAG: phosphoribosylformylglycinamidine synthase I [Anaerolineales bacterium]|nr:phosphoribosylformylglycinamidine synthase I [Anaerolineales bacterium]MCB9128523.1 phosphoribosylformylglycinamidine synthase I [Ardenticatenales bacterium]